MYIDHELKVNDPVSIHRLFEKCIALNLNPKKMKYFFKRYLEYETLHGTQDSIDYVANAAREYVQSKLTDSKS